MTLTAPATILLPPSVLHNNGRCLDQTRTDPDEHPSSGSKPFTFILSHSTNSVKKSEEMGKLRPGKATTLLSPADLVGGHSMKEDATINGYSENGNVPGEPNLIIMIRCKKGQSYEESEQIDAVRDALRCHIANDDEHVQDRISELANKLNQSIPDGHSNLEVVMALDALHFMIISNMIKETRPQEKVKEEVSA